MTIEDALTDIKIAFLQVEFAIKLLSYCELGNINPPEFDTEQVVLLECGDLRFPSGNFARQEDIVNAAGVTAASALGNSALTLDKAWEVAGIGHDPASQDNTVKLRTLVFMIRCAYAHGIADPKWQVHGKYRRVLDVDLPDGPLSLDLRELDRQVFDFEVLGGHTRWFEIRDVTIDTVASIDAGAHA